MNCSEKLVAFMEGKKAEIAEAIGDKFGELYFNKQDKENLLSLSEEKAEGIYEKIERRINTLSAEGLPTGLCPFCCITDDICSMCMYKDIHKKCDIGESDYKKVYNELERKGFFVCEVFSNKFYRKLIAKIEEEDL